MAHSTEKKAISILRHEPRALAVADLREYLINLENGPSLNQGQIEISAPADAENVVPRDTSTLAITCGQQDRFVTTSKDHTSDVIYIYIYIQAILSMERLRSDKP